MIAGQFSRTFRAATLAFGMAFVAGSASAETTLEKIQDQGYINIAFANERPFSYAEPNGELAGVEVELLNHIMKELGVPEIQGSLTTFGSLIPGLRAKRFDLVASAVYIKPDRCKQVAFAEPLYILGDTVIVTKDNPHGIHSYADVAKDPSIKLGYATGGTGVSEKAIAMGVQKDQLVGFNDNPSGFAAVKAGRIAGYATTGLIGEAQLRELGDPDLVRASPFSQPVIDGNVAYGVASFAVRLEDQELLDAINEKLVEFRGSPEYLAIIEKFGFTENDLPTTETTAQICAAE